MAEAPSPITSPPPVPGQPWDATSDATVAGWVPVDQNSGPAGPDGMAHGEFPTDGAPEWKQT